ncbi:MAG TPA: ATP-binding protein [Syntrophales bacterium]|nr:ATP-binding protein [Syntrophales bacterium]HPI56441.1 ATP-binding protein [Syntrophales bacterium]HPN24171.1 ATP-binding protein [Syntrophales bacterium]HQM28524.1 ATP-binding protein [Syntrophales bacterium]
MNQKQDTNETVESREARRRRRERKIILVTIVVIVVLTFIMSHLSSRETVIPRFQDVLIFGLININIILVALLIFLIVRNVVKLVYERRHGILGAKLRTKLVAAFVGLTLVPTIVLFVVAINFLTASIDNWFDIKVGSALNLSLDLTQNYQQQMAESVKNYARQISSDITRNKLYEKSRADYLKTLIEQRQKILKLGLIEILFGPQNEQMIFRDPEYPDIPSIGISDKQRDEVRAGREISAIQSFEKGDFIRGIAPIYSGLSPKEVIGIVVVNAFIPKGLLDKMTVISKASDEYKQFKLLKNPIKASYIIILFAVTLLIIFSATWFGFYLARGITEPIQDLAEGTRALAQGNLDYKIDVEADDEIGVLVDSFNRMTGDLKKSKVSLEQANIDLEQRRKYMETVLRNVSAGVVAVDREGMITTINRAAERMLGIKTEMVLNRKYEEVLRPEQMNMVKIILADMQNSGENITEKQITINIKDRAMTLLVTMGLLIDDDGQYMGMVVVFEDITQLQRAERMAAWREVARRIAHEIKNPLTPIQLSAQRLQRKYADRLGEDESVFTECTKTIISQVDVLKNLVNEFSRYARMPVSKRTPNDLNEVVKGSVVLFQDAHKAISFDVQEDAHIPRLNLDAEQIRRVMVNLLDNAVAAIDGSDGRIEVRTLYDEAGRKARVDVIDNGCGVSDADKLRVFEPYYSTKRSGSGLGLAIVNSIISDHGGHVSVTDNTPKGTIVSFELPIE